MGALEARTLIPGEPRYDPKANFDKVRHAPGWVPWEGAVQAHRPRRRAGADARAAAVAARRGGEDRDALICRAAAANGEIAGRRFARSLPAKEILRRD